MSECDRCGENEAEQYIEIEREAEQVFGDGSITQVDSGFICSNCESDFEEDVEQGDWEMTHRETFA